MARKKKNTFHHGNLKPALIDAALKLLDEKGPEGVTLRAVAREAGVSHAAPANHFKDKKALLTALCTTLFREMASATLHSPDNTSPDNVVIELLSGMIDYGLTHPNRYRMLWRLDLVDPEDPELESTSDTIYERFIEKISEAYPGSSIDNQTIGIAALSMAHGYVSMRLDGNFKPGEDAVTGKPRQYAIIELLLNSLNQ